MRIAPVGLLRRRLGVARSMAVVGGTLLVVAACGGGAGDGQSEADGLAAVESSAGTVDRVSQSDLAFTGGPAPSVIVAHASGSSIVARRGPDERTPAITELENPTPVGGPLAFQVVEVDPPPVNGWIEVYLPIRPNGSTGWVRLDEVELSRNPFRLEIDTGDHRLDVYRNNEPFLTTTVAIGTGETPTPIGQFYIIELLEPLIEDGPYGSFAFGLSGFSETLMSFAGGDGVIGIHGTNDPSSLGTDVSHGCIRVDNEVIESLAGLIPLGTPVVIRT